VTVKVSIGSDMALKKKCTTAICSDTTQQVTDNTSKLSNDIGSDI
jgi:hypothetical protein